MVIIPSPISFGLATELATVGLRVYPAKSYIPLLYPSTKHARSCGGKGEE